jgi:hypothetical protein
MATGRPKRHHYVSNDLHRDILELQVLNDLQRVAGSWHPHPGPEEGADEPSTFDIRCGLRMLSDVNKASHVKREWSELLVTPGRSLIRCTPGARSLSPLVRGPRRSSRRENLASVHGELLA